MERIGIHTQETDQLHLTPKHRLVLEALLHKYLPDVEVWAYGSRVNGRSHEGSDLELALMTDETLSIARVAEMKAAFTKSDLPFRVEIVDWASTSESFRKVIEKDYVVLVEKENRFVGGEWRKMDLPRFRGELSTWVFRVCVVVSFRS